MRINKHDTNGVKPLLGKGELGYDDYTAGGDTGRVYVGTGSTNIGLGTKSEVDTKVAKVTSIDNAIVRFNGTTGDVQNSGVTIDDAGVMSVPSGIMGNASTATTLQTSRTINISGDMTGIATSFNGSTNITIPTTLANSGVSAGTYTSVTVDFKGRVTAGSNPTTLGGYGITDAINVSSKGVANGVATLNASGVIPSTQLPSFVDDVLEYSTLSSFPVTGEPGKIYVDLATNKTYRWSGSAYIYITSGAVDSVAGKTGVVTLNKADVGLNSVDNTADSVKNVLSATKFTTARTINGVSFDGTANITIADSTKEPSITAGTAAQYWRGDKTWATMPTSLPASDVSAWAKAATKPTYTYSEVGAPSTTGANASGTWGISITGNSATTGGLAIATGRNNAANQIVRTDGNGYLQAGYINSSNGNEKNNTNCAYVWGTNGSDDYLRTYNTSYLNVASATNATFQIASSGATCDAKFKNTPAHGTSFSECNNVADAPNTGWWMIYSIRYSNTSNYWGTQIAYGWEDNANAIYQRNISAGTWSAWTRVDVSSANITELVNNAGFITSAGRAYPRRADNGGDLNFYWAGQAGQPTWLWGGNDGNNMYVYNPYNFSVNYANSAGSVTASEVIKFDSGTTEGTDLYTFNGSTAKTIDIKAGTNVTLTKTAGSVTISANDTSVNWSEIQSKPTTLSGYGITDSVAKVSSTDNAIVRFNGTTGAVQNSSVTIDDAGNVGIGVTPSAWSNPYKSIDIGTIGSFIAESASIGIASNSYLNAASNWVYKQSGIPAMLNEQYNGATKWYTAPSGTAGNPITWTTAMNLDSSGSLKALGSIISGYNGSTYATPGYTYLAARAADANSYTALHARNVADANTTYASYVSGILKSAILANGTFQSATGVYGGTSDIKLKENVVDTTPKLEKLMQVQVRNFNYIGQEDKQIGVVAQEIEQIFPSIVFETKDTKQVEVTKTRDITDVDGNVTKEEYTEIETVETGEVTKNVKYSVIYMMMLKAMQEQQEIINDLKVRVEILEGAK